MAAPSLSRGGCRRHLTLGARHLPSRHLPHGSKPMAFLVLASPSRSYLQRWLPSPPRGVFSVAAPCMIPLAGVLDYSAMEVAAPSFPHLPPSVLSLAPLLPALVPPMDAAPSLSSLPLAAMELAPAQVRLPLFPPLSVGGRCPISLALDDRHFVLVAGVCPCSS